MDVRLAKIDRALFDEVIRLVLEEIKSHGLCNLIDIYYDLNNVAAEKVYNRFRFVPTGHRDDGDIIAELKL